MSKSNVMRLHGTFTSPFKIGIKWIKEDRSIRLDPLFSLWLIMSQDLWGVILIVTKVNISIGTCYLIVTLLLFSFVIVGNKQMGHC